MLRRGLEAGDADEDECAVIEAHIRTGRPRGAGSFVKSLEARTGRSPERGKPRHRPKVVN
jgi:hypothetical protein